jgi:hypothetical protein
MPDQTRIVAPYFKPRMVRFEDGSSVEVPEGWILLPPGDAGLTRRVKAAGPTWTVMHKQGKRITSAGVWAPEANILCEQKKVEAERETPEYKRKQVQAAARRDRDQDAYEIEFNDSILDFLKFPEKHSDIASQLAEAVTKHAIPVGSGTVARTKMIPIEKRAEAAVIAWMRHQTTGYDDMKIARVKGKRREVRGELAGISRKLLEGYRRGGDVDPETCPLAKGLKKATT